MIWVIVTNSTNCRIFSYLKNPQQFEVIKEISHPELRLRKEEFLTSDKPGHYKSSATNRGAFSPRTDPKEVEIGNFAREISHELDQGRNHKTYESIILIAAPHMHGLLNQHMNKHVKELIACELQKDISHLKPHEILDYMEAHVEYPTIR